LAILEMAKNGFWSLLNCQKWQKREKSIAENGYNQLFLKFFSLDYQKSPKFFSHF
jgi:hypothetical protein